MFNNIRKNEQIGTDNIVLDKLGEIDNDILRLSNKIKELEEMERSIFEEQKLYQKKIEEETKLSEIRAELEKKKQEINELAQQRDDLWRIYVKSKKAKKM